MIGPTTGQVHREPGFLQHARDLCRREKLNGASSTRAITTIALIIRPAHRALLCGKVQGKLLIVNPSHRTVAEVIGG